MHLQLFDILGFLFNFFSESNNDHAAGKRDQTADGIGDNNNAVGHVK